MANSSGICQVWSILTSSDRMKHNEWGQADTHNPIPILCTVNPFIARYENLVWVSTVKRFSVLLCLNFKYQWDSMGSRLWGIWTWHGHLLETQILRQWEHTFPCNFPLLRAMQVGLFSFTMVELRLFRLGMWQVHFPTQSHSFLTCG